LSLPIEISADHEEIVKECRLLAKQVEPFAMEADESSVMHEPTLAALRSSGLSDLMVPSAYGGRFDEVDPLAVCLAREVFMKTSSHLDSVFALQGIGSYAISRAGTNSQKEEWLPAVAKGDALAALALTEPIAGSDLKGIETTATAVDSGIILNGAKSFISNAGSASFYTTLAKEDDGYSLFLVPADSEGLTVSPSPEIIAPHVLGELTFDEVFLPESSRLGEKGAAFRHVLATLSVLESQ